MSVLYYFLSVSRRRVFLVINKQNNYNKNKTYRKT